MEKKECSIALALIEDDRCYGVIGLETTAECGDTTVCIGDVIRYSGDLREEVTGPVIMMGSDVYAIDYSCTDGLKSFDGIEVLEIVQSHNVLTKDSIIGGEHFEYKVEKVTGLKGLK